MFTKKAVFSRTEHCQNYEQKLKYYFKYFLFVELNGIYIYVKFNFKYMNIICV